MAFPYTNDCLVLVCVHSFGKMELFSENRFTPEANNIIEWLVLVRMLMVLCFTSRLTLQGNRDGTGRLHSSTFDHPPTPQDQVVVYRRLY